MLEKCVLTILELSWNLRFGNKKTKLNICHHMLTSSTQLQNRSFDVLERTRTSTKCQKMKNARAKRAKILFFIVKYANLWSFCCRRRRGCLSSLFPRPRHWICTKSRLQSSMQPILFGDHVVVQTGLRLFRVKSGLRLVQRTLLTIILILIVGDVSRNPGPMDNSTAESNYSAGI